MRSRVRTLIYGLTVRPQYGWKAETRRTQWVTVHSNILNSNRSSQRNTISIIGEWPYQYWRIRLDRAGIASVPSYQPSSFNKISKGFVSGVATHFWGLSFQIGC